MVCGLWAAMCAMRRLLYVACYVPRVVCCGVCAVCGVCVVCDVFCSVPCVVCCVLCAVCCALCDTFGEIVWGDRLISAVTNSLEQACRLLIQ